MKNLIHVTLTIYDPGYKHNEEELMDGCHAFWLTPLRHQREWNAIHRYDPLDCVRALRPDERDSWATRLDVVFDKWAVGFDLADVPFVCATGQSYKSPVDYENSNRGWERFAECAWDIVELFDDLIVGRLPTKVDKWDNPHIHVISGLTLWTYSSGKCNSPFDPEEWDDAWELNGLVKNPIAVLVGAIHETTT